MKKIISKNIGIGITVMNAKSLHKKISQIISRSIGEEGILNNVTNWQKFLNSTLCNYPELSNIKIDQSARLVELISLCVLTIWINGLNADRLEYEPAFLPKQNNDNLTNYISKNSCDGILIEVKQRRPSIVFVEQKTNMIDPKKSIDHFNINDIFNKWISEDLNDKNTKGKNLFWLFNVMPYNCEIKPFDLNSASNKIASKINDFAAGALFYYTVPNDKEIEIICVPIRGYDLNQRINIDEVKKVRFSL